MTPNDTLAVHIELFGALRSPSGERRFSLALSKDANVRQLLSELSYDEREQKYLVVLVNDQNAEMNTCLADGDRVRILLPIGGG
jgi:molybdopterin converting factor small subunit